MRLSFQELLARLEELTQENADLRDALNLRQLRRFELGRRFRRIAETGGGMSDAEIVRVARRRLGIGRTLAYELLSATRGQVEGRLRATRESVPGDRTMVQRYGKGLNLASSSKQPGQALLDKDPVKGSAAGGRPTMPNIATPRASGGDADGDPNKGNFKLDDPAMHSASPGPDAQSSGTAQSQTAQAANVKGME